MDTLVVVLAILRFLLGVVKDSGEKMADNEKAYALLKGIQTDLDLLAADALIARQRLRNKSADSGPDPYARD